MSTAALLTGRCGEICCHWTSDTEKLMTRESSGASLPGWAAEVSQYISRLRPRSTLLDHCLKHRPRAAFCGLRCLRLGFAGNWAACPASSTISSNLAGYAVKYLWMKMGTLREAWKASLLSLMVCGAPTQISPAS